MTPVYQMRVTVYQLPEEQTASANSKKIIRVYPPRSACTGLSDSARECFAHSCGHARDCITGRSAFVPLARDLQRFIGWRQLHIMAMRQIERLHCRVDYTTCCRRTRELRPAQDGDHQRQGEI